MKSASGGIAVDKWPACASRFGGLGRLQHGLQQGVLVAAGGLANSEPGVGQTCRKARQIGAAVGVVRVPLMRLSNTTMLVLPTSRPMKRAGVVVWMVIVGLPRALLIVCGHRPCGEAAPATHRALKGSGQTIKIMASLVAQLRDGLSARAVTRMAGRITAPCSHGTWHPRHLLKRQIPRSACDEAIHVLRPCVWPVGAAMRPLAQMVSAARVPNRLAAPTRH